ncbi:hypothetical protein Pst134EB_025190 [Puccinia striiformis f. sp. tritici]|nr:hypothetical protein Pst134EB_025190 [Puccinia striiformis f. sp. tritici]
MDQEMIQRTEEALQAVTPGDRPLFQRFFELMVDAYLELATHPLRGRFDDEENAHYFGNLFFDIEDLLERMEASASQPLQSLVDEWDVLIGNLEAARATSFEWRQSKIQERLETLRHIDPVTLESKPLSQVSECAICREEFSESEQILVQLPCHPSHLFHRDCIQTWLGKMCRVEVVLAG